MGRLHCLFCSDLYIYNHRTHHPPHRTGINYFHFVLQHSIVVQNNLFNRFFFHILISMLICEVTYILIINHTCMQAVVEEEAQKSAVRVTRKDQIRFTLLTIGKS